MAGQALFYKGECLSGLGGRERDALRAYKAYIRLDDAKPSLVEESEGSIVDLAFELYEDGDAAGDPRHREPAGAPEQGRPLLRGLQAEPGRRQEAGGQGRARPDADRRVREGPRAPRPGPHRPAARLAREPEVRRGRPAPDPVTARTAPDPRSGPAGQEGARLLAQHPLRPGRPGPERHGRGRQGGPAEEGLRPQQDHERAGQVQGEHPPHRGRRRHGHRDLDRLNDEKRRTDMKRTALVIAGASSAGSSWPGPAVAAHSNDFKAIQKAVKQNPAYERGPGKSGWFKVLITDSDGERGRDQGDPAHRPHRAHPELRCSGRAATFKVDDEADG
ncbi:MAG: hypothetical protein MZU95_06995 [Desulfomicrobium escambiense]|nr:hypothetical protein [Desulfomicrobium escambiense]